MGVGWIPEVVVANAWSFGPADVRVPVRTWQGDAYEGVPTEMARQLAELAEL